MPPGNSSNKPKVVERCSYCRSPSCSGERNHYPTFVDTTNPYGQREPFFRRDPQMRIIGSPADLPNSSTTGSVSTITADPKPAVLPRGTSQLISGSGNVLTNTAVSSTTSIGPHRSSTSPTNFSSRSQLSSTNGNIGSNQTVGSIKTSTNNTKPANVSLTRETSSTSVNVGSNQTVGSTKTSTDDTKPGNVSLTRETSSSSSNVGSNQTVGSTKTSTENTKPANVSLTCETSCSSGNIGSNQTVGSTKISTSNTKLANVSLIPDTSRTSSRESYSVAGTYTCIDIAKPSAQKAAVSPGSQLPGTTGSIASDEIPSYTARLGPRYNLPHTTPCLQPHTQMPGTVISSASNNLSYINASKIPSLFSEVNVTVSQDLSKKHSSNACFVKGTVAKFNGSRSAEVKIDFLDGKVKLAQLLVEKFSFHKNGPSCAASVDIKSVLRIGDVITLVCTEHRRKDSAFHYFAHQAWKREDDSSSNNNYVNNDAESVNSFASYGSHNDSEKQRSKSSKRNRRRKKEANEQTPKALGVDIPQWLDNSSNLSNNLLQRGALIEGCEYSGKVVTLRLPYAFLVEVESNQVPQCIFVYSKYFYPEGPNSSSMAQGLSIKGVVCIGEAMVVIPIRSNQQKSTEYEWVARKAWPKRKDPATFEVNRNALEKVPKSDAEPSQSKNSDFVWVKSDQDGAILSLQMDWGLVRGLKNERVFVFARKNAYLFGLSLKNFVLEDVLQEGDLVKFSPEDGEGGEMNANLLYYGCQLPNFNSFVETIHDYCRVRNIKLSVETDLTQLGEEMYSFK